MMYSRRERIACFALIVQHYFSPALSFLAPASGSLLPALFHPQKNDVVSTCIVPSLTAVSNTEDSVPPPFFNSSSLPPPEELPSDVPKDVSPEKLNQAMNQPRTLYEILGASPTESRAEIKKRYAEMAKRSHPDAQIGKEFLDESSADEDVDFGEIAAAWRILGDSKSRKRYDRELQYREWAEYASKFANEKMEEAVPAVAKIMDDLAVPFLRRTAATTYAVSQAVSSIGKSSSKKNPSENESGRKSLTETFLNAIRAGRNAGLAIDSLELKEKSRQLTERAQNDEKRARELQEELKNVTNKRMFASLQSDKVKLSSEEAWTILGRISEDDKENKQQNKLRIEKDIESLQESEQFFIEKLKAYEETDREWNNLMAREESVKEDLTKRKAEEVEARKRLDEAIRMVAEAKANLVATSTALRSAEQKVKRDASEMDRVTFALSKKQERVRQALRKKIDAPNSGIQLDYMSEQELTALRRKEMQLAGESEQLARMVARLSSRAEKLQSRAAALDRYQKFEDSRGRHSSTPNNPTQGSN